MRKLFDRDSNCVQDKRKDTYQLATTRVFQNVFDWLRRKPQWLALVAGSQVYRVVTTVEASGGRIFIPQPPSTYSLRYWRTVNSEYYLALVFPEWFSTNKITVQTIFASPSAMSVLIRLGKRGRLRLQFSIKPFIFMLSSVNLYY